MINIYVEMTGSGINAFENIISIIASLATIWFLYNTFKTERTNINLLTDETKRREIDALLGEDFISKVYKGVEELINSNQIAGLANEIHQLNKVGYGIEYLTDTEKKSDEIYRKTKKILTIGESIIEASSSENQSLSEKEFNKRNILDATREMLDMIYL